MNTRFASRSIFCLLALLLSGCASASEAAVPTSLPPSPGVDLGPVALVWTATGDPNPLRQPSGLAIDAQSNVYVVDTLNNQIRVFNAQGIETAAFGGAGSGDGQFNFAWKENLTANESDEVWAAVALDGMGNLYVADPGNSRIQKLDSQGKMLAQWPTVDLENGNPSQPQDLVIDSQGNIFIVDRESFVSKYNGDGELLLRWGGPGAAGMFIGEAGLLALDKDDNLYVSHIHQAAILKFDGDGNLLAEFKLPAKESEFEGIDPQPATPYGLFVDPGGSIYATDYLNNRIVVLEPSGQVKLIWGIQGKDPGMLLGPGDLVLDAEGNYIISEVYNNRVQKFRPVQ